MTFEEAKKTVNESKYKVARRVKWRPSLFVTFESIDYVTEYDKTKDDWEVKERITE